MAVVVLDAYTKPLFLQRVPKGDQYFMQLLRSHYTLPRGPPPGRFFGYIIWYKGKRAGIIGAGNAIYIKQLARYDITLQDVQQNRVAYNFVFRLTANEKNLASRVLACFVKQLREDWYASTGRRLKAVLTFVAPPRTGTCYKAANWIYLGLTKGRTWRIQHRRPSAQNKHGVASPRKHIYIYLFR